MLNFFHNQRSYFMNYKIITIAKTLKNEKKIYKYNLHYLLFVIGINYAEIVQFFNFNLVS